MTEKTVNGLSHTIGTVEEGHADNIDMLGSRDPQIAATARLNRDLVNVLDAWLEQERELKKIDRAGLMIAAMHAVTTIAGTVLVNLPDAARAEVFHELRAHLCNIFDAMGVAVGVRPESDAAETGGPVRPVSP